MTDITDLAAIAAGQWADAVERLAVLPAVDPHRPRWLPPELPQKAVYRVSEAALVLGVTRQTVDRMIRAGRLPAVTGLDGRTRYVSFATLEALATSGGARR